MSVKIARLGRRAVVAAVVVLLAGATGQAAPTHAATDSLGWSTWGYDTSRTGHNPNETTLSVDNVAGLHVMWQHALSGDKSDNTPVVATGVDVSGTPTDLVYAGDRTGDFHAIDASTGVELWVRNLGTVSIECFGDLGVTDAGVIDPATSTIYVVGGDGWLYGLDLATGALRSGFPLRITTRANEVVWGGLNKINGTLYVTVASGCDRAGRYYGRVVRVNLTPASRGRIFYATDGPTTKVSGGGIWGWGGAAVDPGDGNVYVTTGNALTDPENAYYAEAIIRLDKRLRVVASDSPPLLPGSNLDFGSTPVLFPGPGACGPLLATENKDGELFLYARDALASGPLDRIQVGSQGLIGVPAYDPDTGLVYVGTGTDSPDGIYHHGLQAFSIDGATCKLQLAWSQPAESTGGTLTAPVATANGVAYFGGGKDRKLYAYNAATGDLLWDSGASLSGPGDKEAVVVNGVVYYNSAGVLTAFGL